MKKTEDRKRDAARVRPIVQWAGGKSSLLKHLLPRLPSPDEAACYVEVFGGGAALLLAKPHKPKQAEVYNDSDGELVNAFRQAKCHPQELVRELSLMPNSRAEMMRNRVAPTALTEIQRAAMFLHDRLISFGGDGKSFGVVTGANGSSEYLAEKITAFARRFDRVAVENLDWKRCLALYDTPRTFFFLDPPYVGGAQKGYASWTVEGFRELRGVLEKLAGGWLLTCSESPAMREVFAGCELLAVERAKGIAAKNKNVDRYCELIVRPPASAGASSRLASSPSSAL